MKMAKYASKVVSQAKAWLGYNEADGTHKEIIDIYNGQKPLPVGYKVKYTDAWCATFVSAVAVKLGYTDIIPTECSCPRMIKLFQEKGIWVENENRKPNPGDILFYDWDDNGVGDNRGEPEHVGIVEKVAGETITVIEGNYKNGVNRRTLAVNGKYIRGYGVPKYDAEKKTEKKTEKKKTVAEIAKEVIDGKWGNGEDRKKKLVAAGYDYNAVQAEVNLLLTGKKTVTEIAKEVIAGKWGVGQKRKKRLMVAGYNYNEVQKEVNRLLK
jgi:hypothetical protein